MSGIIIKFNDAERYERKKDQNLCTNDKKDGKPTKEYAFLQRHIYIFTHGNISKTVVGTKILKSRKNYKN